MVPVLWHYEVSSVLARSLAHGMLARAAMELFLAHLARLPIGIDVESGQRILSDVHLLAIAHRLTSYDAAYLELALRRGRPLAKLDADLKWEASRVSDPLTGRSRPISENLIASSLLTFRYDIPGGPWALGADASFTFNAKAYRPSEVGRLWEGPVWMGAYVENKDVLGLTVRASVANVLAAWQAGISVVDASIGGLGGCPFAPGATGNVATEDVVWTFDQMAVDCGVRLDALIEAAQQAAALPGALHGGRIRTALTARAATGSGAAA